MTRLTLAALPLLIVLAAGCAKRSAGPSFGSEDGKKIAILVDSLIDDRSTHARLAEHYAKGAAPSKGDLRKFAPYSFEIVGSPTVTGDTATARVRIVLDSNRDEKGKMEWSFVKEGDQWKVAASPLP